MKPMTDPYVCISYILVVTLTYTINIYTPVICFCMFFAYFYTIHTYGSVMGYIPYIDRSVELGYIMSILWFISNVSVGFGSFDWIIGPWLADPMVN